LQQAAGSNRNRIDWICDYDLPQDTPAGRERHTENKE
jgi:hypothetical protein